MTLAELAARSDGGGASARLALNEPRWAPPRSVLAAARGAAENLHRYPTGGDDRRLVERIVEHHGVVPDQVVVGAGAAGLLRDVLIALCLQQHRRRAVVFAAPGFDLFGMLPGQLDSDAVAVPLTADGEQDLDAIVRSCTERTAVVVVCNPHNPTGPVRRTALRAFLARVPAHVTVLLDEAYSAYVTDPAVPIGLHPIDGGPDRAPVEVLRSFSKSHALGGWGTRGLPAGVSRSRGRSAIAGAAVLGRSTRTRSGAGRARGRGGRRLRGPVGEVTAARADLRAALLGAGYPVPSSHANFLWLPMREWSAHFGEHCAEHGVIVRAYSSHGVRVSIGSPADNESFLAAARRYRGPRQPA